MLQLASMASDDLPPTWFDTRDGALLIGEPAIDERVAEGGAFVTQLGSLITAENFPFKPGDFDKAEFRSSTTEELVMWGKWALKIIQPSETEWIINPLTQRYIRRFYTLGLGPSVRVIYTAEGIGSIPEFQRLIGSPVNKPQPNFRDWPNERLTEHLGRIKGNNLAPTKRQINQEAFMTTEREVPGYGAYRSRGGLRKFKEHLGQPDFSTWSEDDYLEWGYNVRLANPNMRLTHGVINILSKRKAGPSYDRIKEFFGSKDEFWARVYYFADIVESEKEREKALGDTLLEEIETEGRITEGLTTLDKDHLLTFECMRRVIFKLCGNEMLSVKIATTFLEARDGRVCIAEMQKHGYKLSFVELELQALQMEYYDILWPRAEVDLGRLRVTKEEELQYYSNKQKGRRY